MISFFSNPDPSLISFFLFSIPIFISRVKFDDESNGNGLEAQNIFLLVLRATFYGIETIIFLLSTSGKKIGRSVVSSGALATRLNYMAIKLLKFFLQFKIKIVGIIPMIKNVAIVKMITVNWNTLIVRRIIIYAKNSPLIGAKIIHCWLFDS